METPDDENDLFGATIAAQLKKFSPRKAAIAKLNIQKILVDAIMGGVSTDLSHQLDNPSTFYPSSRLLNMDEY